MGRFFNGEVHSAPPSLGDASLSYSQFGVSIKRQRTEDEYFNSDDEVRIEIKYIFIIKSCLCLTEMVQVEEIARLEEEELGYQPKPGSPSYKAEEEDELDAYMKVHTL